MTEVSIRPLARDDRQVWDKLWVQYLAFYETELPETTRECAFKKLLDPAEKTHGFIAEIDGTPCGLVHYIFHDHLWRPEGVCYLQDLFTDENARGKGVARALIDAVYDAADQAGAPRVYWLTQEFNTTARHLYDKVARLSPFVKYDRP